MVALANKEALVCAGRLLIGAIEESGGVLLPVDSEHNAIFQVLEPRHRHAIDRLILTASGGPFRSSTLADMAEATPDQALAHPNWDMGAKISIDSATMMNKGLEVIEARWLFGLPAAAIEVVIHPQSIVHSLVEYVDGSLIAQLSNPDMRVPIAYALGYPERIASGAQPLDLTAMKHLTFERPDERRFPCLRLAYRALERDGTAPALLNAANEVAVDAFLAGRLPFTGIARVISDSLDALPVADAADLETVMAADSAARRAAAACVLAVAA
jgi:1-deoxy-D-xylulose-5-phosphate reductoisomerase